MAKIKEIEKDLKDLKEMVMQSEASEYTKSDAEVVAQYLPDALQRCDEAGLAETLSEGYLAFAIGINKEITEKAFSLLKDIGKYWTKECMM